MTTVVRPRESRSLPPGIATRGRGKMIALAAATAICVYVCYRLTLPFLLALVWAAAVAIVTQPLIWWLASAGCGRGSARQSRWRSWRCCCSSRLRLSATSSPGKSARPSSNGKGTRAPRTWEQILADHPRVATMWEWLAKNFDLAAEAQRLSCSSAKPRPPSCRVGLFRTASAADAIRLVLLVPRPKRSD